jgi:YHS domain-containing protein
MEMKMKPNLIAIVALFLGLGLVVLGAGCKKESATPAAQPAPASAAHGSGEKPHEMAMPAKAAALPAGITQKDCPVTGEPIDPEVYVDYQGRRVYFCCEACIRKFKAEPAKYLAKLDAEKKPTTKPE